MEVGIGVAIIMGKFICAYTGEEFADSERSVEHIVPYAIGGPDSFTLGVVSKKANSEVGRLVDAPFVSNWFIASKIFFLGIAGRNGKKPQLKWFNSETDLAGTRYKLSTFYADTESGWKFFIKDLKRVTTDPVTGKRHISYLVKPEEAEAFLKKVRKRYTDNGVIAEFSTGEHIYEKNPLVRGKVSFDLFDFEKEFIKIALGTAVHKLGTDFIKTPDAQHLRDGLWATSRVAATKAKIRGVIWPNFSDQPMAKIFRSGNNHIIALINVGNQVVCFILLFGIFPGIVQITNHTDAFKSRIRNGVVIEIDPINRTFVESDYIDYLRHRFTNNEPDE